VPIIQRAMEAGRIGCSAGTGQASNAPLLGLRVLHVEDDRELASCIARVLRRYGIETKHAYDAREATAAIRDGSFDLALIDWRLSGTALGLEVAREVRQKCPSVGVVMLTGLSHLRHRVRALREVADDFLIKPVGSSELAARISAVARRCRETADRAEPSMSHGLLNVNLVSRIVLVGGRRVELQTKQYDLLVYLLHRRGHFVSGPELRDALWHSHHVPESSVIRVQLSLLRKALGEAGVLIETGVDGAGWCIRAT